MLKNRSLCIALFALAACASVAGQIAPPMRLRFATAANLQPFAIFVGPPGFTMNTGPAAEMLLRYVTIALGTSDIIYVARGDAVWPGVYAITAAQSYPIVSLERRGYRDGPAALALFDPEGDPGYVGNLFIASNRATGDLYAMDGFNHSIRRIYKDASNHWQVATLITNSNIIGRAVTYDAANNAIWVAPQGRLVRIAYSKGLWNATVVASGGILGDSPDLDCDALGNVYGFRRSGSLIWQYKTASSRLVALNPSSGDLNPANGQRYWDGPVATCNVNQPGNIAVSQDGSTIYLGGGDMTVIKRISGGIRGDFTNAVATTLYNDGNGNGLWRTVDTYESSYTFSNAWNNSYGWSVNVPMRVANDGHLYIQSSGFVLKELVP